VGVRDGIGVVVGKVVAVGGGVVVGTAVRVTGSGMVVAAGDGLRVNVFVGTAVGDG
jgi:hypothetical protein